MLANPYINDKEVPEVKKSFCVFLDILGFSQKIIDAENASISNELLQNLKRVLEKSYAELRDDDGLWEMRTFTDNVVLGYPIGRSYDQSGESDFAFLFEAIARFQFNMVLEGYFIRGGWSVGELFMDDTFVFGKSLIESVKNEKEAKSPRILFSSDMKAMINSHLGFYSDSYTAPQQYDVLQDNSGNYFVNYLSQTQPDLTIPPDPSIREA